MDKQVNDLTQTEAGANLHPSTVTWEYLIAPFSCSPEIEVCAHCV